jgi:hypothetical protein
VTGGRVSVAGLIAVAVGNELVIAHPHDQTSVALSLVLFGGPLLGSLRAPVAAMNWTRTEGLLVQVDL